MALPSEKDIKTRTPLRSLCLGALLVAIRALTLTLVYTIASVLFVLFGPVGLYVNKLIF